MDLINISVFRVILFSLYGFHQIHYTCYIFFIDLQNLDTVQPNTYRKAFSYIHEGLSVLAITFFVIQHSHHIVYFWFIMIVYSARPDSTTVYVKSILICMYRNQFRRLINNNTFKETQTEKPVILFYSLQNSCISRFN